MNKRESLLSSSTAHFLLDKYVQIHGAEKMAYWLRVQAAQINRSSVCAPVGRTYRGIRAETVHNHK